MNQRILIVDDERLTRTTLELLLEDEGFQVHAATNGYEAVTALEEGEPFDIVLTDLRMPSMNGLELQRTISERWPEVDVLLMTAFGSVNTAVQAMRDGAADYLTKPLNTEDLLIRVQRLLARRREREEVRRLREDARQLRRHAGDLIFRSDRMAATVDRALSVADTDATVLLQGETGSGKDVLARLIHARSHRASGPFVAVNCAELNPNLVESELFGHEAGAFTGAVRQRRGRFETAMGGTLLIDEVDDLPRGIQVRLLRFLQDRSFERVGSSKTIRGNVRVLCATKRSLEELVSQGSFREDLYFRINTIAIELPPLRERREDILPLAQHFVARHAEQRGYTDAPRHHTGPPAPQH